MNNFSRANFHCLLWKAKYRVLCYAMCSALYYVCYHSTFHHRLKRSSKISDSFDFVAFVPRSLRLIINEKAGSEPGDRCLSHTGKDAFCAGGRICISSHAFIFPLYIYVLQIDVWVWALYFPWMEFPLHIEIPQQDNQEKKHITHNHNYTCSQNLVGDKYICPRYEMVQAIL